VVAPTGSAAALLNGSTYHSVLGINDGERVSAASLAQIRARLDGVDYIFLDEVSMISCRDMYKISAQAAKARGVYDEPFGVSTLYLLVTLLSYLLLELEQLYTLVMLVQLWMLANL